jgi:hypothetical protein
MTERATVVKIKITESTPLRVEFVILLKVKDTSHQHYPKLT